MQSFQRGFAHAGTAQLNLDDDALLRGWSDRAV